SADLNLLTASAQLRQSLSSVRRKPGQIIANGIPDYVQADSVVGMTQPVAHAPDVVPGLVRHQFGRPIAKTERRLADSLDAAFDSIARSAVALEGCAVQSRNIVVNARDILQNVGQRIDMPRRHGGGPARSRI